MIKLTLTGNGAVCSARCCNGCPITKTDHVACAVDATQPAQAGGVPWLGGALRLGGTVLVWYRGMPAWAETRINAREAEAFMRRWIGLIAGRYRGDIESWDVVNEIIDPKAGRPDGLRPTSWLRALGPRYVDLA